MQNTEHHNTLFLYLVLHWIYSPMTSIYSLLRSYFFLKFYHATSYKALVNQQKEILEAFNNTNYLSDKVSSKHYGRLCNPKLISGWLWIFIKNTKLTGHRADNHQSRRITGKIVMRKTQTLNDDKGGKGHDIILINDSIVTMHQTPDYRFAENTESNMPMRF